MATPEQELKRLLHYGLAIPYYQPGNRLSSYYLDATHTKLTELIQSEKLSSETANCIVKAFSDGYSPYPTNLVNALAICVKQQENKQLREAAYKAVKTVCYSSENLFLFIMFSKKLTEKAQNHSIWGSGCRKVLKEWYLKKDPKVLAEMVGKQKKCHGWSHKDIIKLIHLKTEDPARAAIVKYLLFGIKDAKKEYGENADSTEVLNYLQNVEDLKHLTDEQQAARNIEINHFTLDHVPPRLMKSKEVWSALIGNLPLPVLLKNLENIGYLGFLTPNSLLVKKVVDALKDENAIAESHLHPAQVFVRLRNYERSSKFMAAEKARRKRCFVNGAEAPKKVAPAKPNAEVISALHDLFASTCKLFLAPTGLKYFVAIYLKDAKSSDDCSWCPHISVSEACALTCLCLLHAERDVSIKISSNSDLQSVDINSSMTVSQAAKKLGKCEMMKLSTPIKWALNKKEEHDVFVVISDNNYKKAQDFVEVLQNYREEMKKPNAKFILVLLKSYSQPKWLETVTDPGVFVIGGFDGHVPRLIEAFSRGAF